MKERDYSEWINDESNYQFAIDGWLNNEWYNILQSKTINSFCAEFKLNSIIEFCGGPGITASLLDPSLSYIGVDKSKPFLEKAKELNPTKKFIESDVREFTDDIKADVVVCLCALKHFALDEWDNIATKILSYGRYGIITQPIDSCDRDDLIENPKVLGDSQIFHHVWITEERLKRVVKAAGHEIIRTDKSDVEWYIFTKKKL